MEGIAVLARAVTSAVLLSAAFLACGGQSAESDDDNGGSRSDTGGASGGNSTGGASGRNSTGGASGGAAAVGATGATRPGYCSPTLGSCTLVGGIDTSAFPPLGQPCTSEGNYCQGSYCNDSYSSSSYAVMCCEGKWSSDFGASESGAPLCRHVPQPGEPFPCELSDTSCIVGETHCDERRGLGNDEVMSSCETTCPPGDCSCYCTPDLSGGCGFERLEASGPKAFCTCQHMGAGVEVSCTLVELPSPGPCELYPSLDDECQAENGGVGHVCVGANLPQASECALLDTLGEVTAYCCL